MDCRSKTRTGMLWFMISIVIGSADASSSEYSPWLLHRSTRATNECMEKYRTITDGHSACLPPSNKVVPGSSGVSEQDRRLIVEMHNTARREVTPTANNMQKLSWDNEIANTAQKWAENCVLTHDDRYKRYAYGRFSVGQNLAMGGRLTWERAMNLWINERDLFRYGGNNILSVVGHYTQIVWADTVKVGCGYAQCGQYMYYVCNYGPAGNSDYNRPYSTGSPCGECASASRCDDKLCDCGGNVCLNGGTMDLNSCTCTCKKISHFIQPDCSLNCTDISDPRYCNQFAGGCEIYSNVPQECPKMCDWCPTAGKDYDKETSSATVTSSLHGRLVIVALLSSWCFML